LSELEKLSEKLFTYQRFSKINRGPID
jgi:hypothetical protein